MSGNLIYYRTAERPDIRLWLQDDDGSLVNLNGYTFTFKLGRPGVAATFTKSTGITGAAGAGVEPSGTPNVVITFTAGELDSLVAGFSTYQLRATTGGTVDRIWQAPFELPRRDPVISWWWVLAVVVCLLVLWAAVGDL